MKCWLIENNSSEITAYISEPLYGHAWTICFNHRKAIQFPDKQAAEDRIKELHLKKTWIAIEQVFKE